MLRTPKSHFEVVIIILFIKVIKNLQFVIHTWLHSFLTDNYRVLNMDVAVVAHVVKL